jgi:hypothetical protein
LKRDVQFDKSCTSGGEAHGNEANLYFKDFEDAVQCCSAVNARVDCLITRNKRDYTTDILPILTPEELLAAIAA